MEAPIGDLLEQICVSLWLKPGSLEDLANRDFLKLRSVESIDRLLSLLEADGKIYYKGGCFYTYKKTALQLSKTYELDK